jgi:hypothetical protein
MYRHTKRDGNTVANGDGDALTNGDGNAVANRDGNTVANRDGNTVANRDGDAVANGDDSDRDKRRPTSGIGFSYADEYPYIGTFTHGDDITYKYTYSNTYTHKYSNYDTYDYIHFHHNTGGAVDGGCNCNIQAIVRGVCGDRYSNGSCCTNHEQSND